MESYATESDFSSLVILDTVLGPTLINAGKTSSLMSRNLLANQVKAKVGLRFIMTTKIYNDNKFLLNSKIKLISLDLLSTQPRRSVEACGLIFNPGIN